MDRKFNNNPENKTILTVVNMSPGQMGHTEEFTNKEKIHYYYTNLAEG